ncbi:TlyA family RNA methyltransferase [Egibacter rhizosphaerae]|uniref:TlyA family RNA methyltransferase n=1 Tax=Egibacter rhizosphaerae TaxID=1670831 RepID=A0A411YK69_9ACTN|nr:TlyA family RNA methyltransferase [Egibacter rhizosphaerae]QBI21583.1 TlyA family RNA methyltransferase [Egibacter rhizosphaerae]
MSRRTRLDAALVARGFAASRAEARALVEEGLVTVGGAPAAKPATLVARDDDLVVRAAARWVSRGGQKLVGGLDALEVAVAGRRALDAGASTGGFTDVLLARGAAQVVAVDVGYGQLAWRLRSDERVHVLERTNVRHLEPDRIPPPPPDLVVADLSFISLTLVLPALVGVAAAEADHVVLVKPQFEVGRERVGSGGVVRDPQAHVDAIAAVGEAAAGSGLGVVDAVPSPLRGPAGNVEFFLHLRGGADGQPGGARTVAERAVAVVRPDAPRH